jgi:hypothetical protein
MKNRRGYRAWPRVKKKKRMRRTEIKHQFCRERPSPCPFPSRRGTGKGEESTGFFNQQYVAGFPTRMIHKIVAKNTHLSENSMGAIEKSHGE